MELLSDWFDVPATSSFYIMLALVVLVWGSFILIRRLLCHLLQALERRATLLPLQAGVLLVRSTHVLVLLCASIVICIQFFQFSAKLHHGVLQVFRLAVLTQSGLWASVLVQYFVGGYAERKRVDDPASITALSVLSFVVKLAIWLVIALLALASLGIDISALVAGLGIGGIAVALAVQNILGDLLASLSIILDKPFAVGDFVVFGDVSGTVERIGVKTSHIRAINGEQIIVPNSDLLKSRVRNFRRMQERRVVCTVGVTYDTAFERVEQIPQLIRTLIEADSLTRFDRAHFKSFGDFSLIFEAVYFVKSGEYKVFMDTNQRINMALLRCFRELGIEFAFPTQTLYLRSESEAAGS